MKRHAEFLAFLALWTYMIFVIGTQFGIAHGRYLQKLDDARIVDGTVLDEFIWQIPADPQVKKRRADCAELAAALRASGWREVLVPTMIAISRAEAGCNPLARHRTMTEDSVGQLQINLRAHKFVSEECAMDALCASWAALRIYEQQGLRAWTSYRTASYRQHLGANE